MIGQAEMDEGTSQTGSKSFDKFFVMQCKVQALQPLLLKKAVFVYGSLQG